MFEKALVMYIYAETPLHPGSGAIINSAVDLPIQRERHTEFPMIQGSGVKGTLKNHAREIKDTTGKKVFNNSDLEKIFGPEKGDEGAGAIAITDARILAFPVRTLGGVFGWVTCPLVLDRFKRDQKLAGINSDWSVPPPDGQNAIVANKSETKVNESVFIEDLKLIFKAPEERNYNKIVNSLSNAIPSGTEYDYIRNKLQKDLIIVSDEIFKELAMFTTETVARIAIDQSKGIVKPGALWYEEYLPTDTLMYSLILVTRPQKDLDILGKLKNYDGKIIQIGGNETIGRGFARLKVVSGHDKKP